jgi:hypothetical protein
MVVDMMTSFPSLPSHRAGRRLVRGEGPESEGPAGTGRSALEGPQWPVHHRLETAASEEGDMNSYRVVVGIDGSAESARALRWAVQEAAPRGGTVEAIAVWDWDGRPSRPRRWR